MYIVINDQYKYGNPVLDKNLQTWFKVTFNPAFTVQFDKKVAFIFLKLIFFLKCSI